MNEKQTEAILARYEAHVHVRNALVRQLNRVFMEMNEMRDEFKTLTGKEIDEMPTMR